MTVGDLVEKLLKCDDLNYKVLIGDEEITGCEIIVWDEEAMKFAGGKLVNRVELITGKEEETNGEAA